jgi:hypothetical protein
LSLTDEKAMCGMQRQPRSMVFQKPAPARLGEGLWLDRIQPGGRDGPNREVLSDFPGGRVWTDSWLLGDASSDFHMLIPDIRLPANQFWPLHWHDCWIAVVILDGSCLIGDWWMEKGDVLISADGVEYGPLVIGSSGCQMFEVFADLATHAGGYSPEYRDHPTLQGGVHAFRERSPLNRRNDGRTCLPVDGVEGLIKGRLEPGARWDLGAQDDPRRGVLGYTALAAGETIAAHDYGDWHALFIMEGSMTVGARLLTRNEVLIAEPNAPLEEIVAGAEGVALFEAARTAAGMDRQFR